MIYKVSDYYSPEHDHGLSWNDPALGIDWPDLDPVLSEKDRNHPLFSQLPAYFRYSPSINELQLA